MLADPIAIDCAQVLGGAGRGVCFQFTWQRGGGEGGSGKGRRQPECGGEASELACGGWKGGGMAGY